MPGTYEPISTTTLGSDTSSITLSSIPQTYTDLILVANISGYWTSATYIECGLQVGNGSIDTATNYSSTMLDADSQNSSRQSNYEYVRFWASGIATNNGTYNPTVIHLNNYSNTTTYKSFLITYNSQQSVNTVNTLGAVSGLWRSTSAINTVRIVNKNGTNLYSGSTITLYGIKVA
jgi:hypothetical protein